MKKRILLLALAVAGFVYGEQTDPVKTKAGTVQGVIEDGFSVFRGIPFAAPPVGDLRWKAPQPVKKWDGVLQTTKFAPGPIQGGNPPSGKSEDCLYLNVWSPAKSADEKVPVLVWIYGGGFGAGATSEQNYSGEQLAKKGVVLVSISYRVGTLGFLAHPELSAENPNHVSGNYGLLDMISGLQWVKENIAAFGGDPDKVTIFGESAGGIAVSMLCASPQAKGLFHGAISQSGGSFGPTRPKTYPGENMKTLATAEKEGLAFAEKAGAKSIEDLRNLSADKLPSGSGWPIVDGWVIPDDQYKLYEAGKFNDTPILVGYNSDEGMSFGGARDPAGHIASVEERYGPFAERLLEAYPVGENSVPKTARDLMRDAAFGWQTWSWARLQAEKGESKAYLYYFDQHPEYPAGSPQAGQGSPHGMDVAYVFKHVNAADPRTTESDLKISDAMATYWTNFAKYGHPNGNGVPEWPAFSDENPKVMVFAQTPHVGPVPSLESLKVLDEYFEWRRTPEGKAWADGGELVGAKTVVPDASWDCGMPKGIPVPESGTLLFTAEIALRELCDVGKTPFGKRDVFITGEGKITSERVKASVLSGSLDYQLKLDNGVIEIEDILVLQTSDGQFIYSRSPGVGINENDVRIVMDFEAPNAGAHAWLNSGSYVARRTLDLEKKMLTLKVYDVSTVEVSDDAVTIMKPKDQPAQSWDYRTKGASEKRGEMILKESVALGGSQSVGAGKNGSRNIIPITGGELTGGLKGIVVSGGADYQLMQNGFTIDARYLWKMDNGEYIVVRNAGAFGNLVPTFEAAVDGEYAWFNEGKYLSSDPQMGGGAVILDMYKSE